MKVSGLILELKKASVDIRLNSHGLFLKSSKQSESSDLISEVSNHKEDLIRYISNARNHLLVDPIDQAPSQSHYGNNELQKSKAYWTDKFTGNIPTLNLSTDRPRSKSKANASNRANNANNAKAKFEINGELLTGLKEIGNEKDATLFMCLTAILNVLFYRYTNQTEFIIGTSSTDGALSDLESQHDNHTNTIALWTKFDTKDNFDTLLQKVKEVILGAHKHQAYSFDQLKEELKLNDEWNPSMMSNIMVDIQNANASNNSNAENELDLSFTFSEVESGLDFCIEYNADLFYPDRITKLYEDTCKIILSAISDIDLPLHAYSLLDEKEKKTILESFSTSEVKTWPKLEVLKEIDALCISNPTHLALVEGEKNITYKDLHENVNQLANYLIEQLGNESERRVGLLLNQGIDFTIAQLAIWEANATCVWLNPSLEEATLIKQVRISNSSIILSVKENIKILHNLQWFCKSLQVITLLDSDDFYNETEDGGLMEEAYWDAVNQSGDNEILSGGWTSSFDGKAFSEQEIEEYKENLIIKIDPYTEKYKNILEVGIGSGISTLQLVDRAEHFHGIDISRYMVKLTKKKLRRLKIKNAKCTHLPAHKLNELNDCDFNLIVINSVINCFKGHNYFRHVFLSCIDLIDGEGIIFLGDVMDQDKKEIFVSDLKSFQADNKDSFTKTDWFDELFLSRSYLEELCASLPFVSEIIIEDKIGTIENELLKYRFDAIVKIDKNAVNKHETLSNLKLKSQHDIRDISSHSTSLEGNFIDIPAQAIIKFQSPNIDEFTVINRETVANNLQLIWERNPISSDAMMLRIGDSDIFTFPGNGGSLNYINGDLNEILSSFELALKNHKVERIEVDSINLKSISDKIENIDFGLDHLKWVSIITNRLNPSLFNKVLDVVDSKTNATVEKLIYLLETDNIISHKSNQIDPEAMGEYAGRPVPGTKVYILHQDMQPAPVGIDGHLYVSHNSTNQSGSKSKKEPFFSNPLEQGTFISKTNKKARWLSNGEFVVIDQEAYNEQVTNDLISEMNHHMQNCKEISDSVITENKKSKEDHAIHVYWVKDENADEHFSLETFLEDQIVIGNLHVSYFEVSLIPIDPHGNIDMTTLGLPKLAPRTKVERELLAIWQDVLENDDIGIRMPFYQLGGDSINALLLVSKINKHFNKKFLITDIFNKPSIQVQAQFIDNHLNGIQETEIDHDIPKNNTESSLKTLFEEVLEVDNVGLNKDFFKVGGNHDNANQLILLINKHFDINFQIEMLFDHKTITQLATEIEAIQWVTGQVNRVFEPSIEYIEI